MARGLVCAHKADCGARSRPLKCRLLLLGICVFSSVCRIGSQPGLSQIIRVRVRVPFFADSGSVSSILAVVDCCNPVPIRFCIGWFGFVEVFATHIPPVMPACSSPSSPLCLLNPLRLCRRSVVSKSFWDLDECRATFFLVDCEIQV